MTVVSVCVTFLVGVMLHLPPVMNAAAGRSIGSARVSNGIFWCIAACTAAVIGWNGLIDGTLYRLSSAPLWLLGAGGIGAIVIFTVAVLIPQIGAGNFKVISTLGAVVGGLIISHFGFLGTPQSPITPVRLVGAALMAIGASLAVTGKISSPGRRA